MKRNLTTPSSIFLASLVTASACALSAGIHAALIPDHLRESPGLGGAFVLACLMLLVVTVIVVARPRSAVAGPAAALLLSGLTLAYVASRTTGIPLLEPDPEPTEMVGTLAVIVQLAGAAGALWLTRLSTRQLPGEDPVGEGAGALWQLAAVTPLLAIGAMLFTLHTAGSHHRHGADQPGHQHTATPNFLLRSKNVVGSDTNGA